MHIVGAENSGKAHLGKVLAHEEHAPFINLCLNELMKRSEKELEELLKNLKEVKKAVLFFANAETLDAAEEKSGKLKEFIAEVKRNKGLMVLFGSNKQTLALEDSAIIRLEPSNTTMHREVIKKYAAHLKEQDVNALVNAMNSMHIGEVIELCKCVDAYWKKHYAGRNSERPPLRLYLSMITN